MIQIESIRKLQNALSDITLGGLFARRHSTLNFFSDKNMKRIMFLDGKLNVINNISYILFVLYFFTSIRHLCGF